jgi:hypothetical protein
MQGVSRRGGGLLIQLLKVLHDRWTVITGIADYSHGHQCDRVWVSEKIVVRHQDGIDCGGIERSETGDENHRSDPWLNGANLANQLLWGDVWKVIHNHQKSWFLLCEEFQDRSASGADPKAIAIVATHRPIKIDQLELPA